MAIEVKAAWRWKSDHGKGLRAIAELAGVKRRVVVYLGAERLRPEKGIEVLPLTVFWCSWQSWHEASADPIMQRRHLKAGGIDVDSPH